MFNLFFKSLLIVLTGFFITTIISCKKIYTCECSITDISGTVITTDSDESTEKLTEKQAEELCAENSESNADFIRTCSLTNIDS